MLLNIYWSMSKFRSEQINQPLSLTGSFTGSLLGTSSYADKAGSAVTYVNNSNATISSIQVEDFDANVTVAFVDGVLKFTFGAPTPPTTPTLIFNGFATDRFDKELDTYDVSGSFNVGGYTLVSASLFTSSVLLTQVGSGTTISTQLTTSGSQAYRLEVTASNPLGGSTTVSTTLSGPLSKIPPAAPTQSEAATIQLGIYSGNKIEQGATGSISITSTTGSANRWTLTSFTATSSFGSTPTRLPLFGNMSGVQGTGTLIVTGSATGSNNIVIATTASYESGTTLNSTNITSTVFDSITYTKVRSLRYGTSPTVFDATSKSILENLALWDTTLGGNIGTITNITGSVSNYPFTITWNGNYYHYIIMDSALTLTSLSINGVPIANISDQFTNITTTGGTPAYKIYRSNTTIFGNPETYNYIVSIQP